MTGKILEKEIQKAVCEFLRFKGYFVWKQNNIAVHKSYTGKNGVARNRFIPSTMPGLSDIVGIGPGGRFMAIEVKRPGGELSSNQEYFLGKVKEKKGLAGVVHSIDEIANLLKEWENMVHGN